MAHTEYLGTYFEHSALQVRRLLLARRTSVHGESHASVPSARHEVDGSPVGPTVALHGALCRMRVCRRTSWLGAKHDKREGHGGGESLGNLVETRVYVLPQRTGVRMEYGDTASIEATCVPGRPRRRAPCTYMACYWDIWRRAFNSIDGRSFHAGGASDDFAIAIKTYC
jgi:hypothetical protein